MTLKMMTNCKRCSQRIQEDEAAYICSEECTYCKSCATVLKHSCSTCGGEIVQRPRPKITTTKAGSSGGWSAYGMLPY
ncbi:DUF1272 domain-containing protein [Paenibacillus sp. SC116]|uniref:DUF1272 domain-containing protein n=1 Tax=Paenibacillus sp. SC116 TaxID=2968986 RepID=UPI00215B41AF|nr:DUF1272 domain-containing protein [Paenibacillus sp. SC116]MCR8844682.1 DUF1272 domain-containing protein [Paenibacillus sp. SC116]